LIDAIIEKTIAERSPPPAAQVRLFLNSSAQRCSARRFFVDVAAWDGSAEMFVSSQNAPFDKDFALEILHVMAKVRLPSEVFEPKDAPYYRETCQCHQHMVFGEPCYKDEARVKKEDGE